MLDLVDLCLKRGKCIFWRHRNNLLGNDLACIHLFADIVDGHTSKLHTIVKRITDAVRPFKGGSSDR